MVIPDIRQDFNSILLPSHTWKSNILNPSKEKRDFLLNLYFSQPDYVDSHKKMYYSTYLGAKMATIFSAFNVLSGNSRNPSLAKNLVAKNFVLFGGGCITYGTVATVVANVRGKKDDIWNHVIAGASLGFIYGYFKRSSASGCVFGLFGAIAGALTKAIYLNDEKVIVFENMTREENFISGGNPKYHDWRIKSKLLGYHEGVARTERYNL